VQKNGRRQGSGHRSSHHGKRKQPSGAVCANASADLARHTGQGRLRHFGAAAFRVHESCVNFSGGGSRPASKADPRAKQPYGRATGRVQKRTTPRVRPAKAAPTGGLRKLSGSFSATRGTGSAATFRRGGVPCPRAPCVNFSAGIAASERISPPASGSKPFRERSSPTGGGPSGVQNGLAPGGGSSASVRKRFVSFGATRGTWSAAAS